MKLKPKPIIKKSLREADQVNEKVSYVPTFPHLKRKPSAYKLLDKKEKEDEFKIEDIETITSLIKQLDRKEFNQRDTFERKQTQRKATHFVKKTIRFTTNPSTIKQPMVDKDTQVNESTTLIDEGKVRNVKRYLPRIVNVKSSLNSLSSFDISNKDEYYSSLYTDNNYGKTVKSFSLPISEFEETYNQKIKSLIFDNKILNHKECQPLLQFSQMKQEHFKLFEKMRYLKHTKRHPLKTSKSIKPKVLNKEEGANYVMLEKAFLVPLDKLDEFKLLLINNYLSEIDFTSADEKKRKIFVIVDGTVIINSSYIPGFCIEMPTQASLMKLSPTVRTRYYESFLKLCGRRFNSKCGFKNIVNSELKLIVDLIEIQESDKFIFISASNSYQGISLPLSNSLMKTYGDNYKEWSKKKIEESNSSDDDYKDSKGDNVYEVYFDKRNDNQPLHFKKKSEVELTGNCISFNPTERRRNSLITGIDAEIEEYFYYSDNENRVRKTKEFIKKTLPTKAAFFIYIHNNIYNTKLSNIKKNYSENKARSKVKIISSNQFLTHYLTRNKLARPFKVPKDKGVLTTQELQDGISLLSQDNPTLKLLSKNTIDKRTQTEYNHLLSYNIPQILSSSNHLNRRQLFSFFTQFKSLVALWLAFHQKIPISAYGIDFELFKQCIPQLRNEEEKLLKKIFKQMNASSSTLLSLDEFIEGMAMISQQETRDKIDFFLEVFDKNHNGVFTYEEVKKISTVAIKRLLSNKDSQSCCLEDLRDCLADFIFEIVKCDKNKGLSIKRLKEVMMNSTEKNMEFLEVFCCSNKSNSI